MTYPQKVLPSFVRAFPLPKLALLCGVLGLATLSASAAEPITGTVTNRTNGKPAAGDQVTLIQLQQGMQEATHTTTDARGHFTLEVPDDGIHLVRVTHEKAAYFQPVQPDQHNVAVTVYDAAPLVPGVGTGVEELHIEATPSELHVVEVLQVLNQSSPPRTQFGPAGYEFYLPKGALIGRTGAITQGGMPVQTPAVPRSDPGHYSFLFPLRPGETQFGIAYTVPYTGSFTFTPRITSPVKTFAVILPASMQVKPSLGAALAIQPGKPGTQTLIAQNVGTGQGPEFTVSGTGTLPDAAAGGNNGAGPNASTANPGPTSDAAAPAVSNSPLAGGRGLNEPLDEAGDRDPWSKYKWWILSGLAVLLAGAAGLLLRKPSGTALAGNSGPLQSAYSPVSGPVLSHREAMLAALKEEMFLLETERLQQKLPEGEYRTLKSALELVLGRVLRRQSPETAPSSDWFTGAAHNDIAPASPEDAVESVHPGGGAA